MKNKYLSFVLIISYALFVSCNNEDTTVTSEEDTSTMSSTMDTTTGTTGNLNAASPLVGENSVFAMKAASGGMMEVEAGNIAQQNASDQRIKDFAAMMIRDHGQANNELKSLASSRNMMLPDSMSKQHRDHLTAMRKITGKAFDKHYIKMMLNDHKADVASFEKAANNAADPDLKAWAGKTLPVLKMHLDSVKSISKMKM